MPALEGLLRVGVISDTHGLLRPQALEALAGSDLILHAGDIGNAAVLDALESIAPVWAVRGNNDRGAWAERLPETLAVPLGTVRFWMLHDLKALDLDPVTAGFAAVIAGHSHKPRVTWSNGVLLLNPGSAGPRRFKLPISVARLEVNGAGEVTARIVELDA